MKTDEIVSWRTLFRYLLHGDDRARRKRLAAILSCISLMFIEIALIIGCGVWLSITR